MAGAELLPSGLYRARWQDASGRRRYAQTDDQGQPFRHEKAANRYANSKDGRVATKSRGGMTWNQWRVQWEALRTVAESTESRDQPRLDNYVAPQWGEWRLVRITRADVQIWLNQLAKEKSPSTALRIYAPFARSLRDAVKYGHLEHSPCELIDKPNPGDNASERYLTRDEFDSILLHLDGIHRVVAVMLVATGARFGHVAGLHWERINLLDATVTFAESFPARATMIKADGKTKKPVVVPLPDWAIDELLRLAPENPSRKCGNPHAPGSICRSPLVFTTDAGTPLDSDNWRARIWDPACRLAGVGHVRPHDLRHTYASWLREGNVDLQTVQELLGHAEIRTTTRYAKIGQTEKRRRVLDALSRDEPQAPTG